jgi:hypothetical protein
MNEHISSVKADEAMDVILGDSDLFKIEMSLEGFENIILPIIKDKDNVTSLDAWFEVTKSWRRAINVYSGVGDDKKFEFIVPALTGESSLPKISTARESTHELVQNAIRQSTFIPAAADRGLKLGLSNKVIVDESARVESLKLWAIIYKRYNIIDPAINALEETSTETNESIKEIPIYEDI